jgi:ABC-type spermidine/putrescine transport system permease subunit II
LGGGPGATSPELLMFFDVQRGQISNVVFWALGAQLILAMGTRFFLASHSPPEEAINTQHQALWPRWMAPRVLKWVLGLATCALLSPGLHFVFGQAAILAKGLWQGDWAELVALGLVEALWHSVLLSLCVFGLMRFWAELFLRSSQGLIRVVTTSASLSMVALAMVWDFVGLQGPVAWLLLPLGASLAWLMPLGQSIDSRIRNLSQDEREAAHSLGATDLAIRVQILRPRLMPVIMTFAILAAVASLGEMVFSSFFANDLALLPQLTQRLAGQYRFSGSSWLVFFTSAWTLVLLAFLPKSASSQSPGVVKPI